MGVPVAQNTSQVYSFAPNYPSNYFPGGDLDPQFTFSSASLAYPAASPSMMYRAAFAPQTMACMQTHRVPAQMMSQRQGGLEEEQEEDLEGDCEDEYDDEYDEQDDEEENGEENDDEEDEEDYEEVTQEDKFHFFSQLPAELQVKVWEDAMEGERVVEIRFRGSSRAKKFEYVVDFPALLGVCHSSRKEAKKRYKPFFPDRAPENNFFFDFRTDILLVRPRCSVTNLKFFFAGVKNKDKIERLALPGPRQYETSEVLLQQQKAIIEFSRLRQLVFHDEVGPWAAHEGPCPKRFCCMMDPKKFHIREDRKCLSVNNSPLTFKESYAQDFVTRYLAAEREHSREFDWQIPDFGYKGICVGNAVGANRRFFCHEVSTTTPGVHLVDFA